MCFLRRWEIFDIGTHNISDFQLLYSVTYSKGLTYIMKIIVTNKLSGLIIKNAPSAV